MENGKLVKVTKLVEEKEVVLSKLKLDSNNNLLVDNKPVSGETTTFTKLSDLQTYANNNSSSIGQIYSVVNTTDKTVTIYKVNIDKTVSDLGSGSTDLTGYIKSENLKQGDNITLTKIGNDITISSNATGLTTEQQTALSNLSTNLANKADVGNVYTKSQVDNHTGDMNNPHKTKIEQLIKNDGLLDGQSVIYDGTNNEWKNGFITSDGKVKINNTSISDYLSNQIDGTTIQVVNDKLVVKKIDSMSATITEINYLSGLDENIMTKFSKMGNGNIEVYNLVFSSYANLLAFNFATLSSGKTYLMYVSSDINHSNNGTTYMCTNTTNNTTSLPLYTGLSSATQRDLSVNKIDLTNAKEVTGTLPVENIDTSTLAKTNDLTSYMKSATYDTTNNGIVDKAETLNGLTHTVADIDTSISNSHTHSNKTIIDKISEDANGDMLYNGKGLKPELPDTIMLKTAYDKDNSGAVDLAKSLSAETSALNSTFYGKNSLGQVGFLPYPISTPSTSSIENRQLTNLVKDIYQIVDFAEPKEDTNMIVQCYEFLTGKLGLTENVDSYISNINSIKTPSVSISDIGTKIKHEYQYDLSTLTNPYNLLMSQTDEINLNDFVFLDSII